MFLIQLSVVFEVGMHLTCQYQGRLAMALLLILEKLASSSRLWSQCSKCPEGSRKGFLLQEFLTLFSFRFVNKNCALVCWSSPEIQYLSFLCMSFLLVLKVFLKHSVEFLSVALTVRRLLDCLAAVAVKRWKVMILWVGKDVERGDIRIICVYQAWFEYDWNLGQLMLLMLKLDQTSACDTGVQNHMFAVESGENLPLASFRNTRLLHCVCLHLQNDPGKLIV